MRILQIRFKNLNSLVGEWEVDLAHPAFTSEGIFAITGPTGAGKTTLLDAICLALYGRTPRLSRITKSGNEIMSRQTGECFAEVVFETQSGRFRCHWSQHRARKKPNGELQPPRQEIADADSGLIFEAKLRGVAEQIELATGMDFDRFTRSMLLAQGGFATFLQAGPDDRAPILEQITGTEIYSHISMDVHKRRAEERSKLDLLQAELMGMHLLSEAQEQQLYLELDQKTAQETDVQAQLVHKNQAATWVEGIFRLEDEFRLIETQKQNWFDRYALFKPEHAKLMRANQALELAGDHAGLLSKRMEQAADQQHLADHVHVLPEQITHVSQAEDGLKIAADDLEGEKACQKKAIALIRTVRELDLELREKSAPFKSVRQTVTELTSELHRLRIKHNQDLITHRLQKTNLAELKNQLADTHTDERLVEHLSEIQSRIKMLKLLNERHGIAVGELTQVEVQTLQITHTWTEQLAQLDKLKCEQLILRNELIQKQSITTQDIGELRLSLTGHNQRKDRLDTLSRLYASQITSQEALKTHQLRYDALTKKRLTLVQHLQRASEKIGCLEREVQLLETQLSLLEKIMNYDLARQQLEDGKSCPLCGAKEHPFAEGNIPQPDDTSVQLIQARHDLELSRNALSDLKIQQAETLKDLEQSALFKAQMMDFILKTEEEIEPILLAIFPEQDAAPQQAGSRENIELMLQQLQQENDAIRNTTLNAILSAENIEKEIFILREALDKTKDAVAHSERETQAAEYRKDTILHAAERAKINVRELVAEIQKIEGDLLQDLASYGINQLHPDPLIDLTCRRNSWLQRQKAKLEIERDVMVLDTTLQHQLQQIISLETSLQTQEKLFSALNHELTDLTNRRTQLYGERNPDHEEVALLHSMDAAEKKLNFARQDYTNALEKLAGIKHLRDVLEQLIDSRRGPLHQAEKSFQSRLAEAGFTDEASYLASCLPENERQLRMHQAARLDTEQTELDMKYRVTTALLESERQKNITTQTLEELQLDISQLSHLHRDVQHEIGGIRQILKENQGVKVKQQDRLNAILGQKKECSRWNILHELIGSVDGKKYRNFAQGLTFEMMIGHANRQLLKMTDRYLLSRDGAQPLELNVVDNYQAGEIRSTKNLSGGESFIVSLCLALGLSQMSSQNVRVDSLFLDEGFGTLDDEALDMALQALSGLQQEGKLIGMISHVPALKERIGTQIHVVHQTGGRSVINGPGCRMVKKSNV